MVSWRPGIGVSRLAAYRILKDKRYLKDSTVAIDTTAQAIREKIDFYHPDTSLCHGLTGLCDLLIHADQVLGNCSNKALVNQTGTSIAEKYENDTNLRLLGVFIETPGLMLGLACTGYLCLRLVDPSRFPSILTIA
jgi:lantibiotic modifying enzyme